jgi:hypothetical protein
MPKTHRVEVCLNEKDDALLEKWAEYFGTTKTGAIEELLHEARTAGIIGVRPAGVRHRTEFSLRLTNGMVVHGFMWSRGGQLLGPRVRVGDRYVKIVDGSREFWTDLKAQCHERFDPEHA